jgi:hypothetical protein
MHSKMLNGQQKGIRVDFFGGEFLFPQTRVLRGIILWLGFFFFLGGYLRQDFFETTTHIFAQIAPRHRLFFPNQPTNRIKKINSLTDEVFDQQ